jgi:hypothetical protein
VVVIQPLAVYEVPERVSAMNPDGIEVIIGVIDSGKMDVSKVDKVIGLIGL